MRIRKLKMNPNTLEAFDWDTSERIYGSRMIGFRNIASPELLLFSDCADETNANWAYAKRTSLEEGAQEIMRERKAHGEVTPPGYELGYAETMDRQDVKSGINYCPIHYFLVPKRSPQFQNVTPDNYHQLELEFESHQEDLKEVI